MQKITDDLLIKSSSSADARLIEKLYYAQLNYREEVALKIQNKTIDNFFLLHKEISLVQKINEGKTTIEKTFDELAYPLYNIIPKMRNDEYNKKLKELDLFLPVYSKYKKRGVFHPSNFATQLVAYESAWLYLIMQEQNMSDKTMGLFFAGLGIPLITYMISANIRGDINFLKDNHSFYAQQAKQCAKYLDDKILLRNQS